VRLSEGAPDTASPHAEAGRLAHEIAELKARKKFVESIGPKKFANFLKKLQSSPHYAKEMDGYTDRYLDVLTEHTMSFAAKPVTALETPVPVGIITGENQFSNRERTVLQVQSCIHQSRNLLSDLI